RSMRATFTPRPARLAAETAPLMPPPTTRTSKVLSPRRRTFEARKDDTVRHDSGEHAPRAPESEGVRRAAAKPARATARGAARAASATSGSSRRQSRRSAIVRDAWIANERDFL